MGYRTVFDVTRDGFQWWMPLLMLLFASLFVLIGWGVRKSGDTDSSTKGLLFQLVGAVGSFGAIVFLAFMYGEYRAANQAMATHGYSVVEGAVTNFVPMPVGGHSLESFNVNGVFFEYGSGWGSTTFNSEWNKGLIHDGVQARITYIGKKIIKVETE